MEQIHAALVGCTALVLVASRTALKSQYVQQEWLEAQHSGKRVYIVLYEEVNLPPTLAKAPLVDFRGSFRRGGRVLAIALKRGMEVHEPSAAPGWMNLPRRLPPVIQFAALMLILAAIAMPFVAPVIRFPMVSPGFWSVYSFFMSGTCLWLWWTFLHHRQVYSSGFVAYLLPYFFYGFYRFSISIGADMVDDFLYWWFGYILFGWILIGAVYIFAGADFLRWSVPAPEADLQMMRRWFNKSRREKIQPASDADFRGVLSARGSAGVANSTSWMLGENIPHPGQLQADTYTLVFAPADRPVATSVRRAFGRQKLREVKSGGDLLILILSEYLERASLQRVLDARVSILVLLAGNLAMQGDPLLERITKIQLVDYRDRSGRILPVLARTIKNPADSKTRMAVELTPKSFYAIVLPLAARQIGFYLLIFGAFLVTGGLVSFTMMYFGFEQVWRTDLIGLPIGLALIRIGSGYWHRRTTNMWLIPAVAFSTWLGMAIFLTSFFMFSAGLPDITSQLIFTLSDIFALEGWICFSAPVLLLFVPIMLLNLIPQLRDWLPAPARRASRRERFDPAPDPDSRRWTRNAWLWGLFLVFGLGPAMYGIFWFIINVMTDF